MTFTNTRSTAVLVCFIALIVCVNAHPNGPEGLDEMDFTWISSIGSQFSDLVANDHFAQMTTTPMTGSYRAPYNPQLPSHAQQQPSQPRYMRNSSTGDFSTWSQEFTGAMESQYAANGNPSASSYASLSQPQQRPNVSGNGQQSIAEGERPSWAMFHRHTQPEANVANHHDHHLGADVQSQAYSQPISMSAPTGLASGYQEFPEEVQQGWPIVGQQQHLLGPSADPFNFQAYSMAPLQAPQPVPATFAMSSSQYEPPMSRSAPNIPAILSSDVTNNFNYQPGMQRSSVGNMLGWIGRAPTTGDRAVPRIDTNYLAPPEARSANHSPSTASSTPSSARPGSSRRKPWQMTSGGFICFYCKAGFPTRGDLTHHLRSHQPYMSRQHVCVSCDKRFQYRKDLMRHLPKHDPHRKKYYCPYPGCKYHSKGFGRQDHLDRHLGSQHPQHRIDTPQQQQMQMQISNAASSSTS